MLWAPMTWFAAALLVLPAPEQEGAEKCPTCAKLDEHVDRLCKILAGAHTLVDANSVLSWLGVGDQREQRSRRAVSHLGRLSPQFDYWIFFETAGVGGSRELERAIACEMSARVELLPRYLYAMRYEDSPDIRQPNESRAEFLFDGMVNQKGELLEWWNDEEDGDYRHIELLRLELAWVICGQIKRARGLTEANYEQRCRDWIAWWDKYGAYCRFDDGAGHLVVDQDAMKQRQALPVELRRIPKADRPQPGWCGPLPTLGIELTEEEKGKAVVIRVSKSPYKEWKGNPCTCEKPQTKDVPGTEETTRE